MKKVLFLLIVCGLLVAGCAPDTEPIERTANKLIDEVVKPAMAKATAELSQRSAQLTGQASAINPGYVMEGFGIFGTGVVWKGTIRLDGVSGNIAGATQADQGPDLVTGPADGPVTQPGIVEESDEAPTAIGDTVPPG